MRASQVTGLRGQEHVEGAIGPGRARRPEQLGKCDWTAFREGRCGAACLRQPNRIWPIQWIVPRFGTEGSVVQIHSPRPIPRKFAEFRLPLGSSSEFPSRNRGVGASKTALRSKRSRDLTSSPRDGSVRCTCPGKVLPFNTTRRSRPEHPPCELPGLAKRSGMTITG